MYLNANTYNDTNYDATWTRQLWFAHIKGDNFYANFSVRGDVEVFIVNRIMCAKFSRCFIYLEAVVEHMWRNMTQFVSN